MMTATMAQQLADDDQCVRETLAELRVLLKTPASKPDLFDRIRREARRLDESLRQSLEIEEHDGYLDNVEAHAPNLHERIQRLHREQCELLRELELLRDKLHLAGPALLLGVCRSLDDFLSRIEAHEARKNSFVMHAFNLDPGAPD